MARKTISYWTTEINHVLDARADWMTIPLTPSSRRAAEHVINIADTGSNNALTATVRDPRADHALIHATHGLIDAVVAYQHDKRHKSVLITTMHVAARSRSEGIGTRTLTELVCATGAKELAVHGALDSAKPFYARTGAEFTPGLARGVWSTEAVAALAQGSPIAGYVPPEG